MLDQGILAQPSAPMLCGLPVDLSQYLDLPLVNTALDRLGRGPY
jgi:hypothetical protein